MQMPSLVGLRAAAVPIAAFFAVTAAVQYWFVKAETESVLLEPLREDAADLNKAVGYSNGIDPSEYNKAATLFSQFFAVLNNGTILSYDTGKHPLPRGLLPPVDTAFPFEQVVNGPIQVTYRYDERSRPELWTLLGRKLDRGRVIVGLSEYDNVDDRLRSTLLTKNIELFGNTLEHARRVPEAKLDNELSWAVMDDQDNLVSGIGRIPLRTNAVEIGRASQTGGLHETDTASYYVLYSPITDKKGKPVGTAILFDDTKYFSLALKHLVRFDIAIAAISALTLLIWTLLYQRKHEAEKRAIKEAFQNYFSPQVLEAILREPDRLKLGGQRREVTVLFSDIRSFTALSERLPPQELTRLLQEYFDQMADAVLATDGILDKYIGDAIMAFWGAPIEQPDQADRAVKTALDMTSRLELLQKKWESEGLPMLDIGIGINLGIATVGNFGSARRFDYTVIGDTVNAASRIEALNKDYHSRIIISESTKSQLTLRIDTRDLGEVRVRGKDKAIRVFEILGKQGARAAPKERTTIS